MRTGRARASLLALTLALALVGCDLVPSPSPSQPATPSATVPSPSVPASGSPSASASTEPSATPAPTLALDPPAESDPRMVSATVTSDIEGATGELVVTVTSHVDERIDEIVLRWPEALNETLFLAPFVPSEDRIRDGGPPLVQDWTKWVVGPGEQGEPAGTISVGWGPLMPGATLAIALQATREGSEPIAFDLQLLAGNAQLQLADGGPAEIRVEVP